MGLAEEIVKKNFETAAADIVHQFDEMASVVEEEIKALVSSYNKIHQNSKAQIFTREQENKKAVMVFINPRNVMVSGTEDRGYGPEYEPVYRQRYDVFFAAVDIVESRKYGFFGEKRQDVRFRAGVLKRKEGVEVDMHSDDYFINGGIRHYAREVGTVKDVLMRLNTALEWDPRQLKDQNTLKV